MPLIRAGGDRFSRTPGHYVVDPNGNVTWAQVSETASDRPSPVALAKAAVAIAQGKEPPVNYSGKL